MRSTTLLQYYHVITDMVIRLCVDPGPPQVRKGVELLTRGGYFVLLQTQVLTRK